MSEHSVRSVSSGIHVFGQPAPHLVYFSREVSITFFVERRFFPLARGRRPLLHGGMRMVTPAVEGIDLGS